MIMFDLSEILELHQLLSQINEKLSKEKIHLCLQSNNKQDVWLEVTESLTLPIEKVFSIHQLDLDLNDNLQVAKKHFKYDHARIVFGAESHSIEFYNTLKINLKTDTLQSCKALLLNVIQGEQEISLRNLYQEFIQIQSEEIENNHVVHIVTSGGNYEHQIHRVFLDPKKAETYASTVDDSQVEVWEYNDDLDFNLFRIVEATHIIHPGGWKSFDVNITLHTELDSKKETIERSMYFDDLISTFNPREMLQITRIIPMDVTNEEVEMVYERICETLYNEIKHLIDSEGWTDTMVDEWLENKGTWDNATSSSINVND